MTCTYTYTRLKQLSQRGVTLVELLIVMGLLSILLVVLLTLFTATIDNQAQTEGYSATVSDGRFIMARLNYDLGRASGVMVPASLGASSSNLVLTIGGATYTYGLSGNDLQLTDASGTANLNGDGTKISNLTFQELGNSGGKPTVRYSFTLTGTAVHASGPDTITLTETAGLR